MKIQDNKLYCDCGAEIPLIDVHFYTGCNEEGEDYHIIKIDCAHCKKDWEINEWGSPPEDDIEEYILSEVENHFHCEVDGASYEERQKIEDENNRLYREQQESEYREHVRQTMEQTKRTCIESDGTKVTTWSEPTTITNTGIGNGFWCIKEPNEQAQKEMFVRVAQIFIANCNSLPQINVDDFVNEAMKEYTLHKNDWKLEIL